MTEFTSDRRDRLRYIQSDDSFWNPAKFVQYSSSSSSGDAGQWLVAGHPLRYAGYAELTARVDGCQKMHQSSRAVNSDRELGPWTRVVETDLY